MQTDATAATSGVDLNTVNAIINNLLNSGNQELIAKLSGATDTHEVVDTVLNHFANSGPSTYEAYSQGSMVMVPDVVEEEKKVEETVEETVGGSLI